MLPLSVVRVFPQGCSGDVFGLSGERSDHQIFVPVIIIQVQRGLDKFLKHFTSIESLHSVVACDS